ncbi:MAG: cation-translocating P-type ATPase [Firmicutes bacterium]|nr:cation-translocating P-type ATPase [Bacillota bacterium]
MTDFLPHTLTAEETLRRLNSSVDGLSPEEAARRLSADGKNILEKGKKKNLFLLFVEQFKNAMILILLAAAVVSGILGEPADMAVILAVVLLNALMGVIQESKAEKAIEALNKLSSPKVEVLRGGKRLTADAADIVVGDILVIEAGASPAADARIIQTHTLKADESALTGESEAVQKITEPLPGAGNLGDRRNMCYMGTNAVYGRGAAVVTATGMNTEMGKIARAISETKEQKSPLGKQLDKVGKILSVVIISICVFIFLLNLFQAGGIRKASGPQMLDSFMLSVSLAVAAIPEGLMAVVTLVMSMGVVRMSKRNAIIRKLPAVESLGCAGVICSDKTGTLTKNRMTVTEIQILGIRYQVSSQMTDDKSEMTNKDHNNHYLSSVICHLSSYARLLECMSLCNDSVKTADGFGGDPTETALSEHCEKAGASVYGDPKYARIYEIPFDSARRRMATVNKHPDGDTVFAKGGVDEILSCCTSVMTADGVVPITDQMRRKIRDDNASMTSRALRVLAFAYKQMTDDKSQMTNKDHNNHYLSSADNSALEQNLVFIGLAGMIDPIRDEAADAVRRCRAAGIRPVMITGDHKNTAVAIGKQLGILKDETQALSGAELDALSDAEFDKLLDEITVYARVSPANKVRIVQFWKKRGQITAMTGDGVNDAPALKAADIGVGMGKGGTDVTKNVADIVLADDNFNTIVIAVEEGRKIFANIKKTVQFLLSTNMCEVLVLLIATFAGLSILIPIHILWINLVTDTIPALGLGTQKADKDIMSIPPRNPRASLFSDGTGFGIVYQSAIMTVFVFAAYWIGEWTGSHLTAMTMAFGTLSLCQIAHSFNMKSKFNIAKTFFDNKWLNIGAVVTAALTFAVIYLPGVNAVFRLEPLGAVQCLAMLGLSFAIIPVMETIKWFSNRKNMV